REELALVMAHELAHTILNHPENAMKEKAEWLTSKEYAASLKEVQAAKYERLTRLKKVVETYSLNNSRHHRYHESDADSLAIVLLKNSRIGFDARFFLRLDSADTQYQQPLQNPVAAYFTGYGLSFDPAWTQKRTRGLSARNYNFADSTALNDSLKTHPDCSIRYAQTLRHSTTGLQLTPIPTSLQQKAAKIIIWNLFNKLSLTAALYRILQEKDRGTRDSWYDFMLANIVSGLHHADKTLRRFNAIGIVPKEQVCKSYFELQTALEQIPRDNLAQLHESLQSQGFGEKLTDDARALQRLMAVVIASTDSNDGELKKKAQGFIDTHTSSMYREFAQHFTGK
ncbi:MAG: M48 family metalloprotease, partial [Bacteroidota bacterium]|nr:M48 family metalloprotease [Bacteroidota bacterium]